MFGGPESKYVQQHKPSLIESLPDSAPYKPIKSFTKDACKQAWDRVAKNGRAVTY